MAAVRSAHNQVRVIFSGIIALTVGVVVCLLIPPLAGAKVILWPSMLLVVYLLASAAVAGLVGFIFGVPRARAETTGTAEKRLVRFESNSNLEQISDWLTKLLVGAGLVQLAVLPGFLKKVGDYLGSSLGFTTGPAAAVAIVVYGAGVGFIILYLWARLRLRILLEDSEIEAMNRWDGGRPVVETLLVTAEKALGHRVARSAVSRTLDEVDEIARQGLELGPVLWVDDNPGNNVAVSTALSEAGVSIINASSTSEARRRLARDKIVLVITDLNRRDEDEGQPVAGFELLGFVSQMGARRPPVIVYAGANALEAKSELRDAGALDVLTSPTDLFALVLNTLADRQT